MLSQIIDLEKFKFPSLIPFAFLRIAAGNKRYLPNPLKNEVSSEKGLFFPGVKALAQRLHNMGNEKNL
jgi:hypothetical protein